MRPSLRSILAETYIGAIVIAVFLLWTINYVFQAVWISTYRVGRFVITGILILDIPYYSTSLDRVDRLLLGTVLSYFVLALTCFASAWCFSHWVYGVGPLQSLRACRNELARRNYV
jgi:hypothetical protein